MSRYNEFYVKFELDDETILRFENDSDTHIFQVQIYRVFKILKIIQVLAGAYRETERVGARLFNY